MTPGRSIKTILLSCGPLTFNGIGLEELTVLSSISLRPELQAK